MRLMSSILDWLFPSRCAFCRRLIQDRAAICPRCRDKLPYTGPAARQTFPHVDECCSPLYYVDEVRRSLLRYKFGGASMYAEIYGEILAECIDESHISCDSITWVPLSSQRLRKRGYDQARLLAEATAKKLKIPCVPMLRKTRNNRAQSGTGNAEKRRQNVKNVYAALPDAPIRGKTVLLVDDIVTTGATLSACAEVLRKAGADSVFAATLARRKD